MNVAAPPPAILFIGQAQRLEEVAVLCGNAGCPDRWLDAEIAGAVFPGLLELEPVDIAIWQHPDGSRIRALRYSFDRSDATTLMPAGHWLEIDPDRPGTVTVYSPYHSRGAMGRHALAPLAISMAALRARARLIAPTSRPPTWDPNTSLQRKFATD